MDNANTTTQQESVEKLRSLMKSIRIAMFTTAEPDGSLHSRPMAMQQTEFDGDMWFFTYINSHKVEEIAKDYHVNVSFSTDNSWVSVTGKANSSRDRAKMEELWHDDLKAWFPKGLEDPNIGLIKVNVDWAEYWDTPSNVAVRLYGYAKAKLTGKSYAEEMSEHEKVKL